MSTMCIYKYMTVDILFMTKTFPTVSLDTYLMFDNGGNNL